MVIKLKKNHLFLFLLSLIVLSFLITLKSEDIIKMTSENSELTLPIVMYHQVTEKETRKGKYVIMTDELENDINYLKKCGYSFVTVNDLIAYVNGKTTLPKKIVMITFDDGFESTYRLVWPLLKEKKCKAVVSPVGIFTDEYSKNGDKNINYAYMTWSELGVIEKSEEFEVQNHSFNMHKDSKDDRKGLSRMNGESEEAYSDALKEDLLKMQKLLKENSDINPSAIIYPYGIYSKSTLSVIRELGFNCSMVCEERINKIEFGDKESLYNLGRFNRPSGVSSKDFFKRLGINS